MNRNSKKIALIVLSLITVVSLLLAAAGCRGSLRDFKMTVTNDQRPRVVHLFRIL